MQYLALTSLLMVSQTYGSYKTDSYPPKVIPGYACPPKDVATGCLGPKICHYPNPRSPYRFIQCTAAAIAWDMPCQPATPVWNDKEKICDLEDNVPQTTPEPPPTTRPPPPPTTQPPPPPTTRPPPPPTTRPPPPPTTRPPPPPTTRPPPPPTTPRPRPPTTTSLPVTTPESCPDRGIQCPSKDIVNFACSICQSCNGKPIPTGPPVTPPEPTPDDVLSCPTEVIRRTQCMGEKDCLFAYRKDCSKYIHCEVNKDGVTGRPTLKDCPPRTLWNDRQKVCDHPDNATC